jgi:hypothetical protein
MLDSIYGACTLCWVFNVHGSHRPQNNPKKEVLASHRLKYLAQEHGAPKTAPEPTHARLQFFADVRYT